MSVRGEKEIDFGNKIALLFHFNIKKWPIRSVVWQTQFCVTFYLCLNQRSCCKQRSLQAMGASLALSYHSRLRRTQLPQAELFPFGPTPQKTPPLCSLFSLQSRRCQSMARGRRVFSCVPWIIGLPSALLKCYAFC